MQLFRLPSFLLLAGLLLVLPGAADEAVALKVLATPNNTLEARANACDELGRMGSAKAVPVLAGLLADEKLHDYARDGLERIPDPAAGKALLDAVNTLKGHLRVGVIMTLGDRGDAAAVPVLAGIAKAEAGHAAGAALSSLARVASEDAAAAILAVLADGKAAIKVSAAQSALAAAQRMQKAGDKAWAAKLRMAVAAAEVPDHIKAAAKK